MDNQSQGNVLTNLIQVYELLATISKSFTIKVLLKLPSFHEEYCLTIEMKCGTTMVPRFTRILVENSYSRHMKSTAWFPVNEFLSQLDDILKFARAWDTDVNTDSL